MCSPNWQGNYIFLCWPNLYCFWHHQANHIQVLWRFPSIPTMTYFIWYIYLSKVEVVIIWQHKLVVLCYTPSEVNIEKPLCHCPSKLKIKKPFLNVEALFKCWIQSWGEQFAEKNGCIWINRFQSQGFVRIFNRAVQSSHWLKC